MSTRGRGRVRHTVRKRGRPAAAHDANRWAPDACGGPNLVWETAPHAGRVTQAGTAGMWANSDSRPKGACKESPALPPAGCPLRGLRSLLIYNLCALGGLQRRRPAAAGRKPRAPPTEARSRLSSSGIAAIPQCAACRLVSFSSWFTETSASQELVVLSPAPVNASNSVAIIRPIVLMLAKSPFDSERPRLCRGALLGNTRIPRF